MSEEFSLPPSWCETSIAALATLVRGVSYVKEEARTASAPGHTLLLRANNIGAGLSFDEVYYVPDRFVSDEQLLRDGDVVIAMSSGSKSIVGKAALATSVPRSSFGAFCGVVRPIHLVDFRYFGYYFQTKSYRQGVSQVSKGTGINNLKAEHILDRSLPLPPKAEQARIVSKIDELFSRIDEGERALERVRKLVKRYRQSVLKAAVTGELTREWREQHAGKLESGEALLTRILEARRQAWEQSELAKRITKGVRPPDCDWKRRYKEPSAPKTECLPELPVGWIWSSLGQLLVHIEAGKSFVCDERPPTGEEYGVVKVSAVTWGIYDESESKTITDPKRVNKQYLIKRGDFLFSRANTLELVGACVIVQATESRLLLSDKILRFVFAVDLRRWVDTVLKSHFGRRQIEDLSSGNQHSMRNIGQGRIRDIAIPLPPPLEVIEITKRVASMGEHGSGLIESIVAEERRSTRWKQSILKAAFAGQLVPQDPTDEPASALLERIAAERVAAPKRTSGEQAGAKKRRM